MNPDGAPVSLAFDGTLAVVTLDRPECFNAIDLSLALALREAVERAAAQPGVRALAADRVLALGVIDERVDDEQLDAAARAVARQWAALPQQAVAELKALVQAPGLAALQAQLEREREAFVRCAGTADFAARVAAFAARSPAPAAAADDAHSSTLPTPSRPSSAHRAPP